MKVVVPSRIFCAMLLVASTAFHLPALAQQVDPASMPDEIIVTGTREGTLNLKALLDAHKVFQSDRAAFAPASRLVFILRFEGGDPTTETKLVLRGPDSRSILIHMDADGRFELPPVPKGQWELVHNRGNRSAALRALVMTQGTTEYDRLLGDLRLQCRVSWELRKNKYSIISRAGFATLGGCSSSRFAFYTSTPRTIKSAEALAGDRTVDLAIAKDRDGFRAPLGDRTLPNDTRIIAVPAS